MSSVPLSRPVFFPFSAVCGMEDAKKALMCALVSRNIKSVLIRGTAGIAKTTLVRSISSLASGKSIVNIPLNATEEQLFGGLSLEDTIKSGTLEERSGLLMRADKNIAYIDDVNLFDNTLLTSILNVLDAGKLIIEREGISSAHDFNSLLIGTMNPEDTDLSDHILDRFDICVCAQSGEDDSVKEEILRRGMEFSEKPKDFTMRYLEEDLEIKNKLEKASEILPYVTISDELLSIIAELCLNVGAKGHRGDVSTMHTAIALAAINGRDEVMRKDVEEAAMLCLPHRRDYAPPPPQAPPENNNSPQENEEGNNDRNENESSDTSSENSSPEESKDDRNQESQENMSIEDMAFQIGNQFKVIDYIGNDKIRISKTKSRKGRRKVTESGDRTGRYVRYRMPPDAPRDIAFDATVRAAAPYQKSRDKNGLAIVIESSDLREKIREKRCGCTLMFIVDASGSLGVRKRMIAVKGTILSMLKDSYVKRDRVGMIAFRRDSAELILPPTRSVEYSYRKLEDLPTGGKTPLGAALIKVSEFMTAYSRSHAGEKCYNILITDGRANVPLSSGSNANDEALKLAEDIQLPGMKWIVIDSGMGYPRFDNARKLAEKLNGVYFKLEDLNAETLSNNIRSVINS